MEKFKGLVRVFLTNGAHFEFNMDAEEVLKLGKKLRDYSFVNIGHQHFNKINIAYIEFPDDIMLEDLILCLTNKDYADGDFLDEWTFTGKALFPNKDK